MRAVVFNGVRDVSVETVPDPRVEQPTDALVRTLCSAVCGSDLHPYHGREAGLDAGTVMGHELVGEIVEVGSAVSGLAVGQVVVCPFTTSCGACRPCLDGLTCRCDRGQLFGWVEEGSGLPGTQAELVRVPLADATLVPVPDDVPMEQALLAGDVMSTGLHGAELAGITDGSVVLVVGCGPVGLAAVLAAHELGAERVVAVDGVDERLSLAAGFGATPVALDDDTVARVRELTDGRGVDAVVEAVGSPAATRLAYDCVRAGGTIGAVGVHVEDRLAVSPGDMYDKNLTYRAGRCPARALAPRSLDLIRRRSDDVARLITHRLPLAEARDAYELFDERRDGCVKVLFVPEV